MWLETRTHNGRIVPVRLKSALPIGTKVPNGRARRIEESQMEKKPRQTIRYLRTADKVRLAWAESGAGPLMIKAANWLTHLEYEWESPVWRHWIRFFSNHFKFIRHDERGCGMTDWNVGDLSFERWVEDLEAVVEVAAAAEQCDWPRRECLVLDVSG